MTSDAAGDLPILFCDRGCPFTHRVLALFAQLDRPFDRREAPVGHRPPGLERYSASAQIPLLVHRDLVLTESRVMLDYLAELYQLPNAYPRELPVRARHRHAMAIADDYLSSQLIEQRIDSDARFGDVLGALEAATTGSRPGPSLLAMHLGPLWHALTSWRPDGPITRAIGARPALRSWLDEARELDCVASTATDPAIIEGDLRRAQQAGLLPETFTPAPSGRPAASDRAETDQP